MTKITSENGSRDDCSADKKSACYVEKNRSLLVRNIARNIVLTSVGSRIARNFVKRRDEISVNEGV